MDSPAMFWLLHITAFYFIFQHFVKMAFYTKWTDTELFCYFCVKHECPLIGHFAAQDRSLGGFWPRLLLLLFVCSILIMILATPLNQSNPPTRFLCLHIMATPSPSPTPSRPAALVASDDLPVASSIFQAHFSTLPSPIPAAPPYVCNQGCGTSQ